MVRVEITDLTTPPPKKIKYLRHLRAFFLRGPLENYRRKPHAEHIGRPILRKHLTMPAHRPSGQPREKADAEEERA